MSKISLLGDNNEGLVDIIFEYQDHLEGIKDILELKGKNLEKANRENPYQLFVYDEKKSELDALVKYFQAEVKRIRGKLYKGYIENHRVELSHTAMEKFVDTEPTYNKMNELLLEVQEIRDKYAAAVDAFRARGYALNNITKIRVTSLEDAEIY